MTNVTIQPEQHMAAKVVGTRLSGVETLPISYGRLGFSTCRVRRHSGWLPPFPPLCRALTSGTRRGSAPVGASPAGVVHSGQQWTLYGQLKPFRRAGGRSLRICSSRINTEGAWHLVSSHAAFGMLRCGLTRRWSERRKHSGL
jgi:hypothetical protein